MVVSRTAKLHQVTYTVSVSLIPLEFVLKIGLNLSVGPDLVKKLYFAFPLFALIDFGTFFKLRMRD